MFGNEKVVETKACKHCGASFDITDKDLEFYEKVSPIFSNFNSGVKKETPGLKLLESGKIKYLIPSPTLCPDCRQQRRLSFRNEKTIVFRNCDMTGKRIFSMYSPDKPYKVYHYNDWFTDKWNALDYGQEFDFSKSFFEQFGELDLLVPKMSLSNLGVENSDFVSQVGYCKNCYLIFNAEEDENCYYGKDIYFSRHCVDSFGVGESEQCYYCIRCIQCFNVEYGIYSYNCKDCKYIFSCIGCKNCLGCVNLTNSEYCIFNKKYSREEYFSRLSSLSRNEIKIGYEDLLKISPRNGSVDVKNSENIFGDLISGSKNIYKCFQISSSRDIRYSTNIVNSEDIMDTNYFGVDLQKSYESSVIGHGSNLNFCFDCWNNVDNLMYCFFCVNGVKNCFGCNGLHNNEQYCILNKQYTREEYETLVPKIIAHMKKVGEWGEFFPATLSPFGYNETVAQEYYSLTRGEVVSPDSFSESGLKIGKTFNWSDYKAPFPKVEKIIPASKLPDDISKIPDDILNRAIECEITKKPFRIIKEELDFYRKHGLPIPRKHPDERHLERMSLRKPRKLFERICDCPTCEENHKNIGKYKEEDFEINKKTQKKGKKIQTTYAPERSEIVYCQTCYNKEIC